MTFSRSSFPSPVAWLSSCWGGPAWRGLQVLVYVMVSLNEKGVCRIPNLTIVYCNPAREY